MTHVEQQILGGAMRYRAYDHRLPGSLNVKTKCLLHCRHGIYGENINADVGSLITSGTRLHSPNWQLARVPPENIDSSSTNLLAAGSVQCRFKITPQWGSPTKLLDKFFPTYPDNRCNILGKTGKC
jgi:hypothetical protein